MGIQSTAADATAPDYRTGQLPLLWQGFPTQPPR